MNDISSQNLRPLAARVSVVPSRPKPDRDGTGKEVDSGEKLPPPTKAIQQPKLQQPAVLEREVQKSTKENIEAAVAKMNEYTQSLQRDLQFKLDEASGRTVVTVIDRESKEVVRQIPDEVFLNMARNLKNQMELNIKTGTGHADGIALNLIDARV